MLPQVIASNGYGKHSPGGYNMTSALVAEVVMTLMFLFTIISAFMAAVIYH